MRILVCWKAGFESTHGSVDGHSFMEVEKLTVGAVTECCVSILNGIRKDHPDRKFQDNLVITSIARLDD